MAPKAPPFKMTVPDDALILETKNKVAKRQIASTGLENESEPFDLKRGKFASSIEFASDKPFSVKSVLVEKGKFKGRQILVLEPEIVEEDQFPFLKLPLKIRNMIYALAFVRPAKYHVVIRDGKSRLDCRLFPGEHRSNSLSINPHFLPKFLRLNKQIHKESLPFLYSNRKFRLEDSTLATKFLKKIGPGNIGYLTHVHLGTILADTAEEAMSLLSSAKNLAHLDVMTDVRRLPRASMATLIPLIQALVEAGRDPAKAVDVIHWCGGGDPNHQLRCPSCSLFHRVSWADLWSCEKYMGEVWARTVILRRHIFALFVGAKDGGTARGG